MKTLHEECKKLDFTGLISVNGGYNATSSTTVRVAQVNGVNVEDLPNKPVESEGSYSITSYPANIYGYSFTHNPELAPHYAAIREAYSAYEQSCISGIGFQENYSILCGLVSRKY
ncbi:MAG: hypothetical protein IJL70_09310 [Treponema sp.]|nr:hypothetical protein [Treponema sp.]